MKFKYIFILFFLGACCTQKQNLTAEEMGNDTSIVSLILNISKDSLTKNTTVKLVNKFESSGKIKKQIENVTSDNFLSIVLYKDLEKIDSSRISHPLFKRVEYLGDNNKIYMKEIKLAQSDFYYRAEIGKSNYEIRIFEVLENKRGELAKIKL